MRGFRNAAGRHRDRAVRGYFRVAQAPQNAFAALSSPARPILLSEQTHQVESGRTDLLYRMLRRYVVGTTAAMVVLVPPLLG